jgi:adenine-specific DNA-methyltransferase
MTRCATRSKARRQKKKDMCDNFLVQPMYTYLGNKRKLLDFIEAVVVDVKGRLGKDKLVVCDGFTGSTAAARMLARHASELHTNDSELYSLVAAQCFLRKPTPEQQKRIEHHVQAMNAMEQWHAGVVADMYAPQVTLDVQPGERCYFTRENALRIDTWRRYIDQHVEPELTPWVLCPVLVQMSVHANTFGHFKSFKKYKNGTGCFKTASAMRPMQLQTPVWTPHKCAVTCHRLPVNQLVEQLPKLDLVYYDPPYTPSEYSAYYFLLNVVAENVRPVDVCNVTGLPKTRFKSNFNKKSGAYGAMEHLVAESVKRSEYVLISYSNEGVVSELEWLSILLPYRFERIEQKYKRYTARGTKTGEGHNEVLEVLYLIWAGRAAEPGRVRDIFDSDAD